MSVLGLPRRKKLVNLRNFPFFTSISYFVLFVLYAPLVLVIFYSFNRNRTAQIWTGFSTRWYTDVFTNTDVVRSLKNSLIVGSAATVLSTALAIAAALGLLRMGRKGSAFAIGLLGAPLIIPEIVSAVGTLGFFLFVKIPLGHIALILAHTAFCVPFAMLPIRARLVSLERSSFEAAADLGANEWKIFTRITLPLLAPGIMAGALLAFAISLDDFITSFFIAGPGSTTLPVYIFGMIRSNVTPAINALSTLLLLVSALTLVASYTLATKNQDRK
jgi:spermidine/putrescine transport system permease protein